VGVGHAHKLDVVDVAASACDETAVFLAHNAGANTFNTHILVSLSKFFVSADSFETRRSLSNSMMSGGYSAACATFMRPAASSTDLTML
jgi:hypothetical protein